MMFLVPLGEFLLNLAVAAGIFTGISVGDAHLKQFQDWLWGAVPQQQQTMQLPHLGAEQEAMISGAYQHMATLFEVYRLDQKLQAPPSF